MKDGKKCIKINFLESGSLKIKFKVYTPTTEAFEKFNESQIEKVYGKIDKWLLYDFLLIKIISNFKG